MKSRKLLLGFTGGAFLCLLAVLFVCRRSSSPTPLEKAARGPDPQTVAEQVENRREPTGPSAILIHDSQQSSDRRMVPVRQPELATHRPFPGAVAEQKSTAGRSEVLRALSSGGQPHYVHVKDPDGAVAPPWREFKKGKSQKDVWKFLANRPHRPWMSTTNPGPRGEADREKGQGGSYSRLDTAR